MSMPKTLADKSKQGLVYTPQKTCRSGLALTQNACSLKQDWTCSDQEEVSDWSRLKTLLCYSIQYELIRDLALDMATK